MKGFSGKERRLITGMCMLTFIRTLGASMITPVFSYHAVHLAGASEMTVGLAIGIFGFSQTLFQVPLGGLSDRWGRKNVTVFGSLLYLLGIILCGLSRDIHVLTAARFLAGAGAVSGVTMAWITSGVDEKRRNSAVAYLGICIGAAVIAGFPLSWIITVAWNTGAVFYTCAFFAVIATGFTIFFVEDDDTIRRDENPSFSGMGAGVRELLSNQDLLRLNSAGFLGSLCFSGMFYIMPLLIAREVRIDYMWKIFAPAAVIGTALMFHFAKKADARGTMRIAVIGYTLELAGVMLPLVSHSIYVLVASLIAFYSGHCVLSPVLPVAVSRFPGRRMRGTVLSMFSSFQFLGMGVGGIAGGFLSRYSSGGLFGVFILLVLCALLLVAGFRNFSGYPAGHLEGAPPLHPVLPDR